MGAEIQFALGLVLAATLAIVATVILRSPLYELLIELCGNPQRARFWTSFSVVTLIAVPLIFAIQFPPSGIAESSPVVGVAHQVKWALIGLLISILVLGRVVGRYIPASPPAEPGGK